MEENREELYENENTEIESANLNGRRKTVFLSSFLVLSLLMGFFGAMIGNLVFDKEPERSMIYEGEREPIVIDSTKVDTSKLMTPAEVYAHNVNSTVGITTTVITTNFWGYQTTSSAAGSGFIVTGDGYIVTNYHVIEGSQSITVSLYTGETYDAEIVGYDSSNDIAVLKIESENLPCVILGDSDKLNVGDSVAAIGNPLGELTFSLTLGTVSAKDREITVSTGVKMDLIQTDCAINSGNSGGALFNLYGEVVGITNAKYSNTSSGASIDNIGFAIPMSNVKGIILSIIEKGYYAIPYVGIQVSDVSKEAQGYGMPKGAAVQIIAEDSPAKAGGLAVNDIIIEANGETVDTGEEIIDIIKSSNIGDTLKLKVYRQGQTIEIDLTVGELKQSKS